MSLRSLTTDGVDATKFGLSQSHSSAEEWSRRGVNLLENEHYGYAADAFSNAGEAVWATMASAKARLKSSQSLANGSAEKRQEYFLVSAACPVIAQCECNEHCGQGCGGLL